MLIGTRVQINPAHDRWMMGDRYGEIMRPVKRQYDEELISSWWVKLDKSGKTVRFLESDLLEVA